ncbi:MAG: hypothetical protein ACF8MJ_01045 [Phycisphaerales bacterium JB050]
MEARKLEAMHNARSAAVFYEMERRLHSVVTESIENRITAAGGQLVPALRDKLEEAAAGFTQGHPAESVLRYHAAMAAERWDSDLEADEALADAAGLAMEAVGTLLPNTLNAKMMDAVYIWSDDRELIGNLRAIDPRQQSNEDEDGAQV